MIAKEVKINRESLDSHVLLSMFTTPELIELKVTLVKHMRLEKEMKLIESYEFLTFLYIQG